jgi:pyruvate dehydrogenase (quinone)/pyruvate oxidase
MPGDGSNGVIEALRKRKEEIRFIQARHEEAAALMACGYAKYTGKLGVCVATSGPGAIHLLNGLYDAKLDGQPVLAVTGNQFHDLMNTFGQQDVPLDRLFADVADYNVRIMGPNHVENAANIACRNAIANRTVSHITMPTDIQSEKVDWEGTGRNVPHHVSAEKLHVAPMPQEDELYKAADLINDGKKCVILAGRGALGAGDKLEELAEKIGAPIVKALLGKAAVPDDSPYTTGTVGLLGTKPSQQALEECDTLLLAGTSLPYIEYYPKPDQARAVQIDIDPLRIGLRYPVEIGLVGDCRRTLNSLIPLAYKQQEQPFLDTTRSRMDKWHELMEERANREDKPLKPQAVAAELGKRLPASAILACDSGTVTTWWARHIPVKEGQLHSVSGNLATMACALPYAIAAQIGHPDRPVCALTGDGGFSMLMADFVTCVKYNLPVKVVIINNSTLGQIRWEQMAFEGNPEYACELHPIDYAKFAEACGAKGIRVDANSKLGTALDDALRADGPVLVDAIVDPHEPPLPPKIEPHQAMQFAKSIIRGQPDRTDILKTIIENKVREMT